MPSAREARDWAAEGGLNGLGDSLYTPFSGPDGDDIDYDAYRALVRYLMGDLGRELLWVGGGMAEFWALTMDERKKLLEIAVEETRAVAPNAVVQASSGSSSAKDSLELTLHAQSVGADICYIQTPYMELHGGEGVLRFFKYVAERSDIALGIFNTPSSGYVLTAEEMAQIYDEIPAVVVAKEGVMDSVSLTSRLHALAPGLQIWECDQIVYRAGWLQQGIVMPAQLGAAGYLLETPENPRYRKYWELIYAGEITEAITHAEESGLDALQGAMGPWFTQYPGRPDYFTHWGAAFRYAAAQLGLPQGDYEHSRAPQGILPDEAKAQIREAYAKFAP